MNPTCGSLFITAEVSYLITGVHFLQQLNMLVNIGAKKTGDLHTSLTLTGSYAVVNQITTHFGEKPVK